MDTDIDTTTDTCAFDVQKPFNVAVFCRNFLSLETSTKLIDLMLSLFLSSLLCLLPHSLVTSVMSGRGPDLLFLIFFGVLRRASSQHKIRTFSAFMPSCATLHILRFPGEFRLNLARWGIYQ